MERNESNRDSVDPLFVIEASDSQECSDLGDLEGFSVHNDSSANWLIRRILECRAYAVHCEEWAGREQRRARQDEEFFWRRYGAQLADFVRRRIAENGGRRKSINLPAGMTGFRKEGPKIVIDDDDAVLAWAREHHPELVVVSERLSKSGLNAHIEATGEIPERGVHIEPEREKFYIK